MCYMYHWLCTHSERLCVPADPGSLDTRFLSHLEHLRARSTADIVQGCDVGAPPLPPASTVQLGLLDVVANLQALSTATAALRVPEVTTDKPMGFTPVSDQSHSSSTDHLATASIGVPIADSSRFAAGASSSRLGVSAAAFNMAAAAAVWPDMYYDLSAAHTSHLNVPLRTDAFYLPEDASKSGLSDAAIHTFNVIGKGLQGVLQGVPFLRHLPTPSRCGNIDILDICTPSLSSAAVLGSRSSTVSCTNLLLVEPSVHRGGSTFIFNHSALQIPQHAFPARR